MLFFSENLFSTLQVFDRAIGMIEKQELDPSFGNNELVLNILEAVMEDERSGFEVNARAGKTLAKVPCGQPGNIS